MARLSQVLLGNLQLHHVGCLLNLVEDRTVWLTGLEVQRTVLGLQNHVVAELAIQGLELRHGLLHAVFTFVVGAIDKATPHHNTLVRLQRISQHIGTIGMRALVIARARLSLAVRLHQETTEVWNELIDFLGLLLPPLSHTLVQRVSRLGIAQRHWRSEVDRQVHLDMIRAQNVGYLLHLLQIRSRQHLGRRVDVVQYRTVNTDRGVSASVLLNELSIESYKLVVFCFPEDTLARITTLNASVEVVPMVQQAQVVHGVRLHIHVTAQQGVGAIEQTSLTTC